MKRKMVAILLPVMVFWIGIGSASAAGLLVTDSDPGAGYLTLAWPGLEGKSFVLEGNDGSGWAKLYQGPDVASTLTGLRNGDYTFRASSDTGAATDPLTFTVDHHSLARALGFFGTGAFVFLLLVAVLVKGPRDTDATA